MRKRHHNHLSLFLLSMHLSDRRSYLLSLNISVPARARAKNPHTFFKKKKAEEKRLHAPFIARTLTVVDRTLEEDLVDRTEEEEPIMVDRACAEENIFFFSLLSDTKKEARVENMMLFSSREFDRELFFFPTRDERDERAERERFFALQKTLSTAARKETTRFVFCFMFILLFFTWCLCFSFRICPFLAPIEKNSKKKKFKTLFSTVLSFSSHLCTNRRARVYNHERLQQQTLSLSAFGEIDKEEEEEEELYTHRIE